MNAIHARLERVTGLIFGTYRSTHPVYSRYWLFVGPLFDGLPSTLREAWRAAVGVEVSVRGRSVYIGWNGWS